MNWQSPHRFVFPYPLEIAIRVHSYQVMRWGTRWWQRQWRWRKRKRDIVFDATESSWDHPLRTSVHGLGWTVDKSAGWGMLIQPQPPVCSQGSTNPEYFMALPSTKRLQNWLGSFGSMCSPKVRVQKQTGKQKLTNYINMFLCLIAFHYLVLIQKILKSPPRRSFPIKIFPTFIHRCFSASFSSSSYIIPNLQALR